MGSRPQKPFEFPDGYNNMFGVERYKIPESLFQPQQFLRKVIESNWDHAAKVSCKWSLARTRNYSTTNRFQSWHASSDI